MFIFKNKIEIIQKKYTLKNCINVNTSDDIYILYTIDNRAHYTIYSNFEQKLIYNNNKYHKIILKLYTKKQ